VEVPRDLGYCLDGGSFFPLHRKWDPRMGLVRAK
jgi:hypothetical protein